MFYDKHSCIKTLLHLEIGEVLDFSYNWRIKTGISLLFAENFPFTDDLPNKPPIFRPQMIQVFFLRHTLALGFLLYYV